MSAETGRKVIGVGARGEVVIISRSDSLGREEHEVRFGAISMGTFEQVRDATRTAEGLVKGFAANTQIDEAPPPPPKVAPAPVATSSVAGPKAGKGN